MESEPRRDDGGKYKEPNLSSLVEIELNDDDDFLKIRETLTRIGIASKKDRTLYHVTFYTNAASIISFTSKSFLLWMVSLLILIKMMLPEEIQLQIF